MDPTVDNLSALEGLTQIPQPQRLSLNEIVVERKSVYQRLCGPRISLGLCLQSDLDLVLTHAIHLEKLVLNLILSAKHALSFGGQIFLSTSNVICSEESCQPKRYVRLAVYLLRSTPDGAVSTTASWDPRLTRKLVKAIVLATGGRLNECQESELLYLTEVLLPSAPSPVALAAA